ncbi:unnamed protein product [Penicillium manginii]
MSFARSENLTRGTFIQPPTTKTPTSRRKRKEKVEEPSKTVRLEDITNPQPKTRRRQANLYDAIAGRVTARGFALSTPIASKYRDTASSGARIQRPEEVLFRKDHPMRQVENGEPYFAHENLPADRPLPNSDLLQSIHAYASDFYKYTLGESGRKSHYSMNESALLAVGILVEEMAKDGLGDNGHLLMIEPQGLKGDISGNAENFLPKRGRPVGWRADVDGKKPKAPRRKRAQTIIQPRRKRPRLDELMGPSRNGRGGKT